MMLIKHKTDAMRQLLNLSSRGYFYWTSGLISPKKVTALSYKFIDRYQINATSQQRYRAKLKEKSSTHLILWQEDEMTVHWWLLATEGEGLIHDLEQLYDIRKRNQRLSCTGYEIISSLKEAGHQRWTWRMTQQTEKEWHDRFKRAIRYKQYTALEQAIYSIKRIPAFAGVRQQAFAVIQRSKQEWVRVQSEPWPYEDFKLGWVGRFKKFKVNLNQQG